LALLFVYLTHASASALFPYTTLFRSWSRRCPYCVTSTASPTSMPTTHTTCSWHRVSSTPRTGSGKWTSVATSPPAGPPSCSAPRSEEHTSELQSRFDLVCRLLLEKKK